SISGVERISSFGVALHRSASSLTKFRFRSSFIPAEQLLSVSSHLRPVSDLLLKLLLATAAVSPWPAHASEAADDPKPVQQQSSQGNNQEQNHDPKPAQASARGTPPKSQNLCEALGATAAANELPVDFFTRLIWQESRFKPDAISSKG